MSDTIIKKAEGRPTIMTEACVTKLEEVFRLGVKDNAACAHAGISRETYYRWMKDDDAFCDRMETAKNFAVLAARQVVVSSIIKDKDLDTAKWYIEKHDVQLPQVQNNTQVNVFTQLRDKYTKKPEIRTTDADIVIEKT